MTLSRYARAGAALLIGVAAAAPSRAQVQAPYPYSPATALPPSWSYDPYTSGLGPCPQWRSGDLQPCRTQMPPTYGQPDYWAPGRG